MTRGEPLRSYREEEMAKVFAGVDIGSLTVKVVLLNENKEIIAYDSARGGYQGRDVATSLLDKLLAEHGLHKDDVKGTVATGYGRVNFPAQKDVSEISCQAKGIHYLFPGARTIIDIGGQDSKVIQLLPNGRVGEFAMNDKCAAGTGRFLEVMASALGVNLQEIGDYASKAQNAIEISSFCTVFAESEVISHVSAGKLKEEILAGVCYSVASRVATLAQRVGIMPDVVFTGGVACNEGVKKALAQEIKQPLLTYEEPVITAALGAALYATNL